MNKDLLKEYYDIEVIGMVRLSEKTYKILTSGATYLLKRHDDDYIESIFIRLRMLRIDTFLLPETTSQGDFLFYDEDKRFALYRFYEDEFTLNKDIRLHFYMKSLGELHQYSRFTMNVNDGYFVDKLDYYQKEIDEVESTLLSRVKRIEREDYHNPADWYFFMNYQHLHLSLMQAKKSLDELDEAYKKATEVQLCLTYQNFDYRHIIVRANKILSLDKMAISSCINDLLFLFDDEISHSIDATMFLKEYTLIHPFQAYEAYELLTYLFIPRLEEKEEIKEDIQETARALRYLKRVEKVVSLISSSSTA